LTLSDGDLKSLLLTAKPAPNKLIHEMLAGITGIPAHCSDSSCRKEREDLFMSALCKKCMGIGVPHMSTAGL
jgi:hypothetical protein